MWSLDPKGEKQLRKTRKKEDGKEMGSWFSQESQWPHLVVGDADECAKAIENALAAIQRRIRTRDTKGKFARAACGSANHGLRRRSASHRRVCGTLHRYSAAAEANGERKVLLPLVDDFFVVRFGVGKGLAYFRISDAGLAATYTTTGKHTRFICTAPSFSDGKTQTRSNGRAVSSPHARACCVRHPRSRVPYRERSELRLHRLRRRFRSECVEHGRRARRRLRVFIKRVVLRSRGHARQLDRLWRRVLRWRRCHSASGLRREHCNLRQKERRRLNAAKDSDRR